MMRGEQNRDALLPGRVIAVAVDRGRDRNAGIVDDDIEPAEMRGDLAHHGIDVIEVGDVEGPGFRSASIPGDFGGHSLCACCDEIRNRNVGALGREYPRGGVAHAAGRAGDENGQSGARPAELFEIRHRMLAEWCNALEINKAGIDLARGQTGRKKTSRAMSSMVMKTSRRCSGTES